MWISWAMRSMVLAMVLGAMLAACAPKPTPAAVPSPTPPKLATPAAGVPTPSPSAEEAAWQRIVDAAKKEGKLSIYSVYLTGDTAIEVSRAFANSTGLQLDVVSGSGVVNIERIKTERRAAAQIADLMDTSANNMFSAKAEGITASSGQLPQLQEKDAWNAPPVVDKEGHILSTAYGINSPWVNPRLVKPEQEPKSYLDLLKPEWKGRIAIQDASVSVTPILLYYHLTSSGTAGDDYFSKLGKQQPKYYPTSRHDSEALARGEASLSLVTTSSSMRRYLGEQLVRPIPMAEGVQFFRSVSLGLIKGAPHPNAAAVYLNWFLSREGQTVFNRANVSNSARKDVPPYEPKGALTLDTAGKVFYVTSAEDTLKVAEIQRSKVVQRLLAGQ